MIDTTALVERLSTLLGAPVSRRLLYMWASAKLIPPPTKTQVLPGNKRSSLLWSPKAVKACEDRIVAGKAQILASRVRFAPKEVVVPKAAKAGKEGGGAKVVDSLDTYDPDWRVKKAREDEERAALKISTLAQAVKEWEARGDAAAEREKKLVTSLETEQKAHGATVERMLTAHQAYLLEQEEHAKTSAALTLATRKILDLEEALAVARTATGFSKEESEYLAAWLFMQVCGHSSEAKRQIHQASAPFTVLQQVKNRYTLKLAFEGEGLSLHSAPKEGVVSLVNIPDRSYTKHPDTDGIKEPKVPKKSTNPVKNPL